MKCNINYLTILVLCAISIYTKTIFCSTRRSTIRPDYVRAFRRAQTGAYQVTELENLRHLFVIFRRASLQLSRTNMDNLFHSNQQKGKMQKHYNINTKFLCNTNNTRSKNPPLTVHKVRPGDIDIIAAIGDSISAGNGEISENILDIVSEYRGISFSGGGCDTWRKFLTLPNILKEFNPNLYGYAIANDLVVDKTSRFNIAEPMIMSRDLLYQIKILINRMRSDPNVDMENHWKLLTIFVGNNDVCSDICHYNNTNIFLKNHENDLRRSFDFLRDNVPRIIVNLIPAANMVTTLFRGMKNVPFECSAVHTIGCHCVFSRKFDQKIMDQIWLNIFKWQEIEESVANQPEYQTDTFSIMYHPFMANVSLPSLRNGNTDLRFLASDCFHLSQLGHASLANSLWNSMMQPFGSKQMTFLPAFQHFECPTELNPFFGIPKFNNSS